MLTRKHNLFNPGAIAEAARFQQQRLDTHTQPHLELAAQILTNIDRLRIKLSKDPDALDRPGVAPLWEALHRAADDLFVDVIECEGHVFSVQRNIAAQLNFWIETFRPLSTSLIGVLGEGRIEFTLHIHVDAKTKIQTILENSRFCELRSSITWLSEAELCWTVPLSHYRTHVSPFHAGNQIVFIEALALSQMLPHAQQTQHWNEAGEPFECVVHTINPESQKLGIIGTTQHPFLGRRLVVTLEGMQALLNAAK